MSELIEQLERIRILSDKQLEDPDENIYTILAHTNEELGEFCTAICVEDGSSVKSYKTLKENSEHEAVDVVICALSLYYSRGGKTEDLYKTMTKKLNKWESQI